MRRRGRRWLAETVVGLLMIPLTAVPIVLYLGRTGDGYLMWLKGRYALAEPGTPRLDDAEARIALEARRRLRAMKGVPVLVYHGIGRTGADVEDERFVVTREHFAEQMRSLRAAGYEPITTRQLALYLTSDPSAAELRAEELLRLPGRPVVVTFDDGRTDAMIQADPILRDTGMAATMFVIGKRAESGSLYYESLDRLRKLAGTGRWELANHTYDLHEQVERGPGTRSALVDPSDAGSLEAYRRAVAEDLDRNQALVAGLDGSKPVAFAYPFGDWGSEAPPGVADTLDEVLRTRFELAFDQDAQSEWRPALPGDDLMHLHRLQVMDWSGPELLARLTRGVTLAEHAWEERGLGYRYSDEELALAAAATVCPEPGDAPVRAAEAAGRRAIALSFNGGPAAATPAVLDALARHGAAATFFVSGSRVEGRERLLQRMLVDGNEVANGTFSGADLSLRSDGEVADELRRTSEAILAATGDAACLVRPPFGADAERVARIARSEGMTTALWSIDPRDYEAGSAGEIAARVLADARPGGVIVLHDGGDADRSMTAEALPAILDGLAARGYEIVTVSSLLAPPPPPVRDRPVPDCRERSCEPDAEPDSGTGVELVGYVIPDGGAAPASPGHATGGGGGGASAGHPGSGTGNAGNQGGQPAGGGSNQGPDEPASPPAPGSGGTTGGGGSGGSTGSGGTSGGGSGGSAGSGGTTGGGGTSGGGTDSGGGGSSGGGSSGGGTSGGSSGGGTGGGSSGGGSGGGSDGSGSSGGGDSTGSGTPGNGNGNGPPSTPPGHGGEPPGQAKDKGKD